MSLHDVSLSSLGSCIVSILIDVITNASDGSILRQINKKVEICETIIL